MLNNDDDDEFAMSIDSNNMRLSIEDIVFISIVLFDRKDRKCLLLFKYVFGLFNTCLVLGQRRQRG